MIKWSSVDPVKITKSQCHMKIKITNTTNLKKNFISKFHQKDLLLKIPKLIGKDRGCVA